MTRPLRLKALPLALIFLFSLPTHSLAADREVMAQGKLRASCQGNLCEITVGCAVVIPETEWSVTSVSIMECHAAALGVSARPVTNQGPAAATAETHLRVSGEMPDQVSVCFSGLIVYQTTHDPVEDTYNGCSEASIDDPLLQGWGITPPTNECRMDSECITASGAVAEVVSPGDNPNGGATIFECVATASGAWGVAITECQANAVAAPQSGAPGPIAATAGSLTFLEPVDYRICWSATALFTGGFATTSGCEEISSTA